METNKLIKRLFWLGAIDTSKLSDDDFNYLLHVVKPLPRATNDVKQLPSDNCESKAKKEQGYAAR